MADNHANRRRRRAILLVHELGLAPELATRLADAAGDSLGDLDITDSIADWRTHGFTDDEIIDWCEHSVTSWVKATMWRGLGFTAAQGGSVDHAMTSNFDLLTPAEWDAVFFSDTPRDLIALALTAEPDTKQTLDTWLAGNTSENRDSLRLLIALKR